MLVLKPSRQQKSQIRSGRPDSDRWPKGSDTNAKKSIAGFRVREDMPLGAKVTLRGDRMYEFLDRLITIAMPRIRDFRGVSGQIV